MQSEWDVIKSISGRVSSSLPRNHSIYGIGDDCAVYTISGGRYGLFSTDISIEDVHFDFRYTSYHDAGYRSMSANISDIYAMGGKPVLALIALGVPESASQQNIDELYDGIIASALKNDTFIAGGDISRSDKMVISISIYGETGLPVYRSGSKPGEFIYVTGTPGLSKLGLELLQNGYSGDEYPLSLNKHLTPDPQKELLRIILAEFSPTSMIDISDGLLSDLRHICSGSGTGFTIDTGLLPQHGELKKFCNNDTDKINEYILYSGEEYELLFTSPLCITGKDEISCIGRITESGYCLKNHNTIKTIEIKGYDHFE